MKCPRCEKEMRLVYPFGYLCSDMECLQSQLVSMRLIPDRNQPVIWKEDIEVIREMDTWCRMFFAPPYRFNMTPWVNKKDVESTTS